MMKKDRLFQGLFIFLLLVCAQPALAQGEASGQPARPRYRMELVWVEDNDGDKREYILAVGPIGFKTVQGLKNFVARLPRGAILEWSPGCLRWGGEPLLSSDEEMEGFRRFCEEHGVEFILHPSG
jgi:hypothetical protein